MNGREKVFMDGASASVCVVNQTVGVLNANSSTKVKATDFKFDTRLQEQSGDDPLKFMEKVRVQGHVTSKIVGC